MEPFNITVENPWLKLVEDNGIIAECDKNAFPNSLSAAQYAEAINKGNKDQIRFVEILIVRCTA